MEEIIGENAYYIGDNLEHLKKVESESIDFIYFDPPYNTGRNFFNFDDRFKSVEDYLNFIRPRVQECFRCLKPGRNIVIHIEPKISHYFRIICDEIFGLNNFKNEIEVIKKQIELFNKNFHLVNSYLNNNGYKNIDKVKERSNYFYSNF